MNDYAKTILRCLPAFCIICVSWYLSSQPTIEHMPSFWNADKLVHFVCFGGLAFWVSFAFLNVKSWKIRLLLSTAFVSLYGVIDEIHQSFTLGRSCSVFDWLADTTGAFFGCLIFLLVLKVRRSALHNPISRIAEKYVL